jgi:hypothetical protein
MAQPKLIAPATPAVSQQPLGANNAQTFPNDRGNASVAVRFNSPVTSQLVANQQLPPSAPPAAPANPFSGFTASPPPAAPAAPATFSPPASNVGPPPGVQLRWINTRAFTLVLDTRAMSGLAGMPVELWGTRDGGQSWQSFGRNLQGQNQMVVTVPEEGIFGFRMVVQTNPSMAGRPPLPGDQPNYWVGIDLTRPVGRITRVQQGAGRDGDKLFIAWEASDNRELAARPISLSYSERPGGPWTSMAAGLDNTGQFAWQLAGSLPQRVYLRLEIRDAAGNMGLFETPEPVSLELSSPAAQVRDLRPLGLNAPPAGQEYLR